MSGLEKSPQQLAIEQLLRKSADLLKRANRYVSVHPSIGGQQLGEQITNFRAELLQNTLVDLNLEEETHG
jgi:hypothetical protein